MLYVDNDYVLFPLMLVLTVIMIWCSYQNVFSFLMRHKRLMWVEVQDCREDLFDISRKQSKANLKLINEETNQRAKYSSMFDAIHY